MLSLTLFLGASLLAGAKAVRTQHVAQNRMGQVVDWSSRHVPYPQGMSHRALALSERDPRAYWNYLRLMQAAALSRTEAARNSEMELILMASGIYAS